LSSGKVVAGELLQSAISNDLDPVLGADGFARRRNGVKFTRVLEAARHELHITSTRPRFVDDPSDLHVAPILRVGMPAIETTLEGLVGDASFSIDAARGVIAQSIGLVGLERDFRDWRPVGKTGFVAMGESLAEYIRKWVIPFFDDYTHPEDIVRGHETNDGRLPRGPEWSVLVAAAYTTVGEIERARELLTETIGSKAGLRKHYGSVLEGFGVR
jgi:hypothetical protein